MFSQSLFTQILVLERSQAAISSKVELLPTVNKCSHLFFSLQIFNTSQARSTQYSQYLLKVTKIQCDCDCTLACFCPPSQRVLAQKRGLGLHRAGSPGQDDGSAQWPPGTESPKGQRGLSWLLTPSVCDLFTAGPAQTQNEPTQIIPNKLESPYRIRLIELPSHCTF